ncbi:MAG: hypothetical protein AB7L65_08170, partial [Hyphomonadaceae bacterium]
QRAAKAGAIAAWIGEAQAQGRPDRLIVLVESPLGARRPLGLSGHTWRPLGALLPAAIALRAEPSRTPGVRVRLAPFSDVPDRGAVARYDGLIEVGPEAGAPNRGVMR